MNSKTKHIFFWTASIIATLFFGLLTLLSFSEWWTVAIKKDVGSYPWGHINDNPWYYDNADLYAKVMLTEGVIMFTAVAVTVWFLTQQEKAKTLYSLMACFGLFIFMIINGHIE